MCVCACVCVVLLEVGGRINDVFVLVSCLQGINFTPSRLVVPTKKAHILLAHADKKGKQHEFQEVSWYLCDVIL